MLLEGENHACEQQPSIEVGEQENESQSQTPQTFTEPRRSARNVTRPDYCLLNDPAARTDDKAFVSQEIIMAPVTYKDAIARKDAPIWKSAMDTEMDQHNKIGTWKLVDLPPD